MQGRKMVMTASLGIFLGVLLLGMQITLFHLNSLLPPAQSVRAYSLEKLDEGEYRVELLGEPFKVKLPGGEKVIETMEQYLHWVNIEQMSGLCSEEVEAAKEQGEKVFAWLNKQWESLEESSGNLYESIYKKSR